MVSSMAIDPELLSIARNLALRRLNTREYSAGELKAYLGRKKVDPETAELVISELKERGMINDERYARIVTRSQYLRGKGPGYIQNKLRTKGISLNRGKVSEIISDVGDVSELETARRVVESRYPNAKADRKEAQRAYQGLMRRGFSFDIARKAIFEAAQVIPPEEGEEAEEEVSE
jgi:SOS response regulatory protein OraA/RecX